MVEDFVGLFGSSFCEIRTRATSDLDPFDRASIFN